MLFNEELANLELDLCVRGEIVLVKHVSGSFRSAYDNMGVVGDRKVSKEAVVQYAKSMHGEM